MLTTTLNEIKSFDPCTDGWGKLLSGLNKTTAEELRAADTADTADAAGAYYTARAGGAERAEQIKMFALFINSTTL